VTDWGLGEYELTAERLMPAAQRAVAALAPRPGERIVDVGCGTGNAALLAARAGAEVTGLDLAERLLDVARGRAAEEGLPVEFKVGDAAALPAPDDAFDAAISVFGVIFADGPTAAAELLRVTRPGGRIVVTTWTDTGPTPKVGNAIREALGGPPGPAVWSDPEVVRSLFAPHRVEVAEAGIAFEAPSVEAYVSEQATAHPMWLGVLPALRQAGKEDEVTAEITRIFTEANEDPAAFRTTSRYRVTTVVVG
jgi:SAM-dependent methyltransferase